MGAGRPSRFSAANGGSSQLSVRMLPSLAGGTGRLCGWALTPHEAHEQPEQEPEQEPEQLVQSLWVEKVVSTVSCLVPGDGWIVRRYQSKRQATYQGAILVVVGGLVTKVAEGKVLWYLDASRFEDFVDEGRRAPGESEGRIPRYLCFVDPPSPHRVAHVTPIRRESWCVSHVQDWLKCRRAPC